MREDAADLNQVGDRHGHTYCLVMRPQLPPGEVGVRVWTGEGSSRDICSTLDKTSGWSWPS